MSRASKIVSLAAVLLFTAFTLPCHGSQEKIPVVCSIEPLRFFVEAIAGDLAEIEVMVPPGASPATYEPRPCQMAMLSRARLYFAAGVPFERAWLSRFRAQNPSLSIIDVNEGLHLYEMARKHGVAKKGTNLDPHTWLSPPCTLVISRNIYKALLDALPNKEKELSDSYVELVDRIARLDTRLMKMLRSAAMDSPYLLTFHPAWGYFARAYGLEQIPVEMEGKEPSPKELDRLAHKVKELGIGFILVQPQFSQRSARALSAICGLKIVVADPLSSSWEENLIAISKAISEAARAATSR